MFTLLWGPRGSMFAVRYFTFTVYFWFFFFLYKHVYLPNNLLEIMNVAGQARDSTESLWDSEETASIVWWDWTHPRVQVRCSWCWFSWYGISQFSTLVFAWLWLCSFGTSLFNSFFIIGLFGKFVLALWQVWRAEHLVFAWLRLDIIYFNKLDMMINKQNY